MGKQIDMTGQRFGRLIVMAAAGVSHDGRTLWRCKCDCGNEIVTRGKDLRQGKVNSCGCARREHCSERMKKINTKHGLRKSRLYCVWRDMKVRVMNPNHKSYGRYGGRGITICEEWLDYKRFYDWAMSSGYNPDAAFGECTLDRINNDGNYEPGNCRWVDLKVQANNRHKPVKPNQAVRCE